MSNNSLNALGNLSIGLKSADGVGFDWRAWTAAAYRHIRALETQLAAIVHTQDDFRVTTICGSMRFMSQMLEQASSLSMAGHIVLMPFCVFEGAAQQSSESKKMLDAMHFAKISMSTGIFVVNPGGYIGESTRREIEYARETGKKVEFLVPESE